jgi:hypothetical protein
MNPKETIKQTISYCNSLSQKSDFEKIDFVKLNVLLNEIRIQCQTFNASDRFLDSLEGIQLVELDKVKEFIGEVKTAEIPFINKWSNPSRTILDTKNLHIKKYLLELRFKLEQLNQEI